MIKLGLDNSPMANKPWLAGFLEADGLWVGIKKV